mmetsp:Transcript_3037/g.12514  ORF Transcript_3037/g.12514 Transcript_3037/m.12514 type:complete len:200 (-) Transcript_3037:1038-1637(-)
MTRRATRRATTSLAPAAESSSRPMAPPCPPPGARFATVSTRCWRSSTTSSWATRERTWRRRRRCAFSRQRRPTTSGCVAGWTRWRPERTWTRMRTRTRRATRRTRTRTRPTAGTTWRRCADPAVWDVAQSRGARGRAGRWAGAALAAACPSLSQCLRWRFRLRSALPSASRHQGPWCACPPSTRQSRPPSWPGTRRWSA